MTERGKRIFSKLREVIDAIVLINGDEPNLTWRSPMPLAPRLVFLKAA